MAKKLLQQYYTIDVEPYLDGAANHRQRLSILPSFVLSNAPGDTVDWCIHLVFYSNPDPALYNSWNFIHMVIVADTLEILTAMPEFIAEIASLSNTTQPQEVEALLQKLGMHRKWTV